MIKTSIAQRINVSDLLDKVGVQHKRRSFLCPVHPDQRPSAVISPTNRSWKCFACGVSGGILDLAIALGIGWDFASAARELDTNLFHVMTYNERAL